MNYCLKKTFTDIIIMQYKVRALRIVLYEGNLLNNKPIIIQVF